MTDGITFCKIHNKSLLAVREYEFNYEVCTICKPRWDGGLGYCKDIRKK